MKKTTSEMKHSEQPSSETQQPKHGKTPTVFELAQLALHMHQDGIQAADRKPTLTQTAVATISAEREAGDKAVARYTPPQLFRKELEAAYDFWMTAEQVISTRAEAVQQLAELQTGLLKFPADEWEERLRDFKGDRSRIEDMLDRDTVPLTAVMNALCTKNDSRAAKHKITLGLAPFAKKHNVKFSDNGSLDGYIVHAPQIAEEVYPDTLRISARIARRFAEARHVQQRLNMKRPYGPPKRGRRCRKAD